MCIFLLAAGLSLLKDTGSKGAQIGPVALYVPQPTLDSIQYD